MLPADGFGICNLTQNCVICRKKHLPGADNSNETPGLQKLQALDAVIRERGFERAAQKRALHNQPSHSALSNWKICSGAAVGAYRTAAPDGTRAKTAGLLRQVELLEEEWLGDEQTG